MIEIALKKNSSAFQWNTLLLIILFIQITSCNTGQEYFVPTPIDTSVDSTSAGSTLFQDLLSPDESRKYKAFHYGQSASGFQNLYTNEFLLKDSAGNDAYVMRIYTNKIPLRDSIYQTTDNKYNPYRDKVYVEFYKNGNTKEELYISENDQKDNIFELSKVNATSSQLDFRFLAKYKSPERYAILRGRLIFRR